MDATQVLAILRDNRLFDETDEGVLLRAAVRALGEVKEKLRPGADAVPSVLGADGKRRTLCRLQGGRYHGQPQFESEI